VISAAGRRLQALWPEPGLAWLQERPPGRVPLPLAQPASLHLRLVQPERLPEPVAARAARFP
jgi:hypothetical protein